LVSAATNSPVLRTQRFAVASAHSGSILKQKLMEHPRYEEIFPKSGLISPSSPSAGIRYFDG
jgi:hypothetical protein